MAPHSCWFSGIVAFSSLVAAFYSFICLRIRVIVLSSSIQLNCPRNLLLGVATKRSFSRLLLEVDRAQAQARRLKQKFKLVASMAELNLTE